MGANGGTGCRSLATSVLVLAADLPHPRLIVTQFEQRLQPPPPASRIALKVILVGIIGHSRTKGGPWRPCIFGGVLVEAPAAVPRQRRRYWRLRPTCLNSQT